MTMIGWPGEVRAEANAVYTALTQGERTHWVVAKWQFVKTASLANRLLRFTTHAVALPEPRAPANVPSQNCSN